METPKLNKQLQNTIYMIFVYILLAIGVFFFAAKPFAKNLKTTSAQFQAIKREKIAKEQKLSDLKSLEKNLEEFKTKSDPLIKALPAKEDVPGILVGFEALFHDTGMPMNSFSTPAVAAATSAAQPQNGTLGLENSQKSNTATQSQEGFTLSKLSFTISTSGSYSKIINFLTALQNNLRIVRLNDISISPSEKGSDFTLDCTVQVYYLNQGTSATQNSNQGANQ